MYVSDSVSGVVEDESAAEVEKALPVPPSTPPRATAPQSTAPSGPVKKSTTVKQPIRAINFSTIKGNKQPASAVPKKRKDTPRPDPAEPQDTTEKPIKTKGEIHHTPTEHI